MRYLRWQNVFLRFKIKIKGWVDMMTKIVVNHPYKDYNNAYFLWGLSYLNHLRTTLDILLVLHLIFCTSLKTRSMCLWCMKYSQRVAFQVCHIMYIFIYNYNNWNCAGKISDFHTEYLNIFYLFSLKIMSIVKMLIYDIVVFYTVFIVYY